MDIMPYRLYRFKYLNFYLKGFINQQGNSFNSKYLVCEYFHLIANFGLNLGTGVSFQNFANPDLTFLTGFRKYFSCMPINFFKTYLSFDLLINKKYLDWISSIYVELYDRDYKKFTFSFGYQSIFNKEDLMLNLNYKYYFYDRTPYNRRK